MCKPLPIIAQFPHDFVSDDSRPPDLPQLGEGTGLVVDALLQHLQHRLPQLLNKPEQLK